MNQFSKFVALSTVSALMLSGASFAQDHRDDQRPDQSQGQRQDQRQDLRSDQRHDDQHQQQHDNHQYVQHREWKKGYHMNHDDWGRGEQVDYRAHHLRTPPRGYEWRQVDGNYVLAAVATGVIASVIAASLSR